MRYFVKIINWSIFLFFAIFASLLPSIDMGVVNLYPLRIVLIIWLLVAIGNGRLINMFKTGSLKKSLRPLCLFLFFGVCTLVFATDISTFFKTILIYITSLLTFLFVIDKVKTKNDIVIVSIALIVNVLIQLIMAMIENRTGNYFYETEKMGLYRVMNPLLGGNRPKTVFVNVNNLSAFFALCVPICILATENIKHSLMLKIVIFLFIAYGIILTDSRSGMLCLLFQAFYLTYAYTNSKKRKLAIILGIALFLTVLIAFLMNYQYVINLIFPDDVGDEDRLPIWSNYIKYFFANYTFGCGVGCSPSIFGIPAHNYLLEILVEFGLIGFIPFIIFFLTLYPKNQTDSFSLYFRMLFISFLIVSIASSSMIGFYFLWLFWGMSIAYDNIKINNS